MHKKNRKNKFIFLAVIVTAIFIVSSFFIGLEKNTSEKKTEGIMLLIEFEETQGLENFVNEINDRNIPSLLLVSSDFVLKNCEEIKKLQLKGVEVGGTFSEYPLWDINYDEQYRIMRETKDNIEKCTGRMRIFGSKYFAYDENTLRSAQNLKIEFILARGTTGPKATIYKPIDYNVKIFSVSNVGSKYWGTGSLCDYSYWARGGDPKEFEIELKNASKESKISPVTHTYIGGLKQKWNEVYMNFFDTTEIKWQTLDEFGTPDITLYYSQIPNNREVQYETPKPKIPLDQEENVQNICG